MAVCVKTFLRSTWLTGNRDFLLFIPSTDLSLGTIMTYYTSALKMSSEGDVVVGSDNTQGLGITHNFLSLPFGVFSLILAPPIRHRPPDDERTGPAPVDAPHMEEGVSDIPVEEYEFGDATDTLRTDSQQHASSGVWPVLTALMPKPGYFVAGAVAGIVSRTSTAPLDRLKVYLITQTGTASKAVEAAKQGSALQATKHAARPLVEACKELWRAGGIRSLFAGEQAQNAPGNDKLIVL